MADGHPFRFGVVAERTGNRDDYLDLVRRTEAAGYSTLFIRDHLAPDFFGVQFGPIAALATAAAVTRTLRIGTLVFANDYRHPTILAKEAATLDVLSDGRLELGLGAGWLAEEYRQTGLAFDSNGVRITRMMESVHVLKGLFGGEPFSFNGEHYHINGLSSFPRPVQRPYPPILIGGGHRRILTFAGREANIVGLLGTSVASGTVQDDPANRSSARTIEQIGWVRDGAGDRFAEIELSQIPTVVITDRRRTMTEAMISKRSWSALDVGVESVWDMPSVLIGSTDDIGEQLREWRERLGITYIVVSSDHIDTFAPVVARLAGS